MSQTERRHTARISAPSADDFAPAGDLAHFHCIDKGQGTPQRPWVLADLSANGARLEVDAPRSVPDEFALSVHGHRGHWVCRVVWRGPSSIGVAFQERPAAEASSSPTPDPRR